MTRNDWWYLRELWNGNLLAAKKEAESKCSAVEADPFRVEGDA